jgi:hypothetical protein
MQIHRDSTDYSGTATWDGASQDGASGVIIGVSDILDASGTSTGQLIGGYQADLLYDGTCINVVEVRSGRDFSGIVSNIDNSSGASSKTTFLATSVTGEPTDAILAFAQLQLVGTRDDVCSLEVTFTSLIDEGAVGIPVDPTAVIAEFRRGNGLEDANMNVGDALFTAQYLVGVRAGCTAIKAPGSGGTLTCLNPVNMVSVIQDEMLNVGDLLFLKQHLVGLRNNNFQ